MSETADTTSGAPEHALEMVGETAAKVATLAGVVNALARVAFGSPPGLTGPVTAAVTEEGVKLLWPPHEDPPPVGAWAYVVEREFAPGSGYQVLDWCAGGAFLDRNLRPGPRTYRVTPAHVVARQVPEIEAVVAATFADVEVTIGAPSPPSPEPEPEPGPSKPLPPGVDFAATFADGVPLSRTVNYSPPTGRAIPNCFFGRYQPDLQPGRPASERGYTFTREANPRFASGRCVKIEIRGRRSVAGKTWTDDYPDLGSRERAEFAIPQGGRWGPEDRFVNPGHDLFEAPGVAKPVFYAASFRPGPCILSNGQQVKWQRPIGSADPGGWVWGTCWDLHRPDQTGEQTEPATFHLNCENRFYIQWSGGQPGTREASIRKKVDLYDREVYPGEWSDFVLEYKVATIDRGHFKLWRRVVRDDGSLRYDWKLVLQLSGIPTLQASRADRFKSIAPPGKLHYWKTGYYRSYEDFTTIWRTGGLVRAASFEAAVAGMWDTPAAARAFSPGFSPGFD